MYIFEINLKNSPSAPPDRVTTKRGESSVCLFRSGQGWERVDE